MNYARRDLCGGRSVMGVPTAIQHGNRATQGFRELTLPSFVETVRLKYTLT